MFTRLAFPPFSDDSETSSSDSEVSVGESDSGARGYATRADIHALLLPPGVQGPPPNNKFVLFVAERMADTTARGLFDDELDDDATPETRLWL